MSLLRALRTLVVDDEEIARRSLIRILEEDPEIAVVGQCAAGDEALAAVGRLKPDLMLLDIQMPGLSGLEVARQCVGETPPWIIFVTAYDEYAVKAFEAQAVDYLLKPVEPERLRKALGRAKQAFHGEVAHRMARKVLEFLVDGKEVPLQSAMAMNTPPQETPTLSIPQDGGILRLEIERIRWIESADQHSILHCDGEQYRLRRSMGDLESHLGPSGFFRLHRSYLVPLHGIERLDVAQTGGAGEVILRCGKVLPVSRARLSSLRSRLRE